MNRSCKLFKLVSLSLLAFVSVWAAQAQQNTGEITGTVSDASGALISGASIVVTNTDTREVVRTTHAGSKGLYVVPLLPAATYSITASAPGFSGKTINNLQVDVASSLKENFSLVPGEAASVTVTDADNLAPDMENGAVSTVISGDEMQDMALNTHNFEQVLQLQPGVTFGGTSDELYTGLVGPDGNRSSAGVSINGLRPDQNAQLLDGMDNLEHNTGQGAVVFPAIDAISHLRVTRNSYGAQYGGGGSAQIQIATRSGKSVYHGNLHLYARNSIFNANDWFNNFVGRARPDDSQYTFGGAVGGPVFIPHLLSKETANTFFFYAFEGRHDAVARVSNITNIPTPAELAGTFSGAVCYRFTDPTFDCALGAMTSPGGTIPQSAFDPVAQAYLKDVFSKFPVPNNPSDVHGVILDPVNAHREYEQFVRLDRSFGSRLNMFFRYVYDPVIVDSNAALFAGNIQQYSPNAIPGVSSTHAETSSMAYTLDATYALTPNIVVEGTLSYEPYHIIAVPTGTFDSGQAPDVVAALQLPYPSQLARVPTISVTPATYGATGPVHDINETFQASTNIFYTVGRHTFSFGGNWELYRESVNQGITNAGLYHFANGSFQQSFANFEVGKAATYTQSTIDPVSNAHVTMAEGFVQDDWKILPRLTINVGVRYSFFRQPEAVGNTLGSFEPAFYAPTQAPTIDTNGNICLVAPCAGGVSPNPSYNPLNGLVQGGVNSPFGKTVSRQPVLNFAPRFGFAADVFGDGNTALRGGFGIFYDQTQLDIVHNIVYNNPAYVQVVSIADPASFADPGASYTASTNPAPLPAYGLDKDWSTPYTMGYSIGVQQLFPRQQLVNIAYSGNRSRNQPGQIDINQPTQGAFLTAGMPAIVPANVAILNQIRPFLGYQAIIAENTNFIANYNALQTSYNVRIGGSSRFSLNYTWSRGLTDSQGSVRPNGSFAGAPQNSYCIMCEYGLINFDRRHVFTAHYQYTLPYYKRGQHGFYQHLVGGFELSGIITAAAGLPLTPKVADSDPAGVGITTTASPETERPDVIGPNPNDRAPHTRLSWIGNGKGVPNPFVAVNALAGRSGNASVGDVRGPGYQVWNLGVFKNIDIRGRQTIQLRVQAFNAFNHVNWQGVDMQMGNGTFGQVTSDRDPREMELGIKYAF